MVNTETKTIETQYGTTEIEVVECDSCGQTIGKDEAVEFTIGNREGYACQHCEQDGPIKFPNKLRMKFRGMGKHNGNGFFGFAAMAPIFLLISMSVFLFEDNSTVSDIAIGNAWAAWSILLWVLLFLFIYVMAGGV